MLQQLYKAFVNPKPIVVVSGLPRSGTSMMMQMLAAGGMAVLADDVRTPDVNNPQGYYELERVKKLREGDDTWLLDAQGRAVKVISALLPHLPDRYHYKIIFMQRALDEVLQSQQKMLQALGEPTGRYSHAELASRYQAHLETIMTWLDQQATMTVLYVHHHDIMADARGQAAQIEAFLQLDLDVTAMAAVVNLSLYRNQAQDLAGNER